MGIKALTAGLKEANVEMRKLAEANSALSDALAPGGGGGAGGAGAAPPTVPQVVNFNTTMVTQVDLNKRPSVRTGDGSAQKSEREEELIRAFGFFGMSFVDKSQQYQDQILALFRNLTKKLDGLGGSVEFRMSGGG